MGLAQIAGLLAGRDAALLGAPASATPAPGAIAVGVILLAALLPGTCILRYGVQKGLLLSIVALALYLVITGITVTQLGLVVPLIAPISGWYLRQILGIGWRPHSHQDVRHVLPASQRRVFISYRRSLDEVTAPMLKNELAGRGFDVFLDVDNLGGAARFDQRLLHEIAGRYNFVLLLSPGSLDRCHETGDWIRLELEQALATQRRIVPVTRAGFQLGADRPLPPQSQCLVDAQCGGVHEHASRCRHGSPRAFSVPASERRGMTPLAADQALGASAGARYFHLWFCARLRPERSRPARVKPT